MHDTLKAWLNGTRDYVIGVSLYKELGSNEKLKALFSSGYTMYNNYRLQEELRLIYNNERIEKKRIHSIKMISAVIETTEAITGTVNSVSAELHASCKKQADHHYKLAMNSRAVLFSMVPALATDYNRPDLVESRKTLCLEILREHAEASELYDRADKVKKTGQLPEQENAPDIASEVSEIPDIQVKQALDNARKARNKIKNREVTPERVQLLHNHNERIKLLEERWHCLQQKT